MAKRLQSKGRSYRTNKTVTHRVKKFYKLIYEHSKNNKKRNEEKGYKKPDSSYFFLKYPDEKSFLKVVKIKDVLEKR